jgi:hypothetical protein
LLHTKALGPALLSGGATGPEGSLYALPLVAIALLLSWRFFGAVDVHQGAAHNGGK